MSKKYRLIISNKARVQLRDILVFHAEFSRKGAARLKSNILNSLATLEDFPESHPFLIAEYIPRNKYRKMVVDEYLLILYQLIEEQVYIEYVIDGRRGYSWLID